MLEIQRRYLHQTIEGPKANCDSKFAEHMAGHVGNRRSWCVLIVDNIEAEIKGDYAKLRWPASLNGEKTK